MSQESSGPPNKQYSISLEVVKAVDMLNCFGLKPELDFQIE